MNKSQNQLSIRPKKKERTLDIVNRGLSKRYRAERRFRLYGLLAIVASMVFLSLLFISITGNGYTAFQQTFLELVVDRGEKPRGGVQVPGGTCLAGIGGVHLGPSTVRDYAYYTEIQDSPAGRPSVSR